MGKLSAAFVTGLTFCLLLSSCAGSRQPDDVVRLRGGLAYNANTEAHESWTAPLPLPLGSEVELRTGGNYVRIRYRDHIETEAGRRVNIIFYVTHSGLSFTRPAQVDIKPVDLPAGWTSRIVEPWQDTHVERSDGALRLVIVRDAAPGEYHFDFSVCFDGSDYGRIPCTVKVARLIKPREGFVSSTERKTCLCN